MIDRTRVNFNGNKSGFTIVELLVVIVVIGILAAITIVAYSGISNRAVVSSLQSDLTNGANSLKLFQVDNSNYPTTIDCTIPDSATNKCVKASNGNTFSYAVSNTTNPQTFCITATKNSNYYSVSSNGTIAPVAYCPVLYLDAGNTLSYPGSGTNWADLSGSGNNGTLINGVGYNNTAGGVLSFDGVNDYVNLPNDIVTTSNIRAKGITYSAWVKSVNTAAEQRIIGQKPSSGYSDFAAGGLGISGNKAKMIAYDDNISYKSTTGNTTLQNNLWYFIVGTYDMSDKNIRIFVNGVLDGTPTTITTFNRLIANAENLVGALYTTSTDSFSGTISNVSIHNRVLSPDEILQSFNSLRGRYGI